MILGVPTLVFDSFILVNEPEVAAQCLEAHGYVRTKPNPRFLGLPTMSTLAPRLVVPPAASTPSNKHLPANSATGLNHFELQDAVDETTLGVVLLAADLWPHNPLGWQHCHFVPYPAEFLNCLISTYLETSEDKLREHIATHISYFYGYLQDLRNPEFELGLLEENRQVHFDMLYSKELMRTLLSAKKVQDYHLEARENIRRGKLEPGLEHKSAKPRDLVCLDKQQTAPWNRPLAGS